MKKFSKIINQQIGEEPKIIKRLDESDIFKYKMLDLMGRYLKIKTSGPIDDRLVAGRITIEGKEMLVEALFDLLTQKTDNEQTKILESLKNEISNWEAIDNKIDSLKKEQVSLSNRRKFKNILEMYEDDETFLFVLEKNTEKITNTKTLIDYSKLIEDSYLNETTKQQSIDICQERIKKL